MHEFSEDFYGSRLSVCVAGYIRPELKFNNLGEVNDWSLSLRQCFITYIGLIYR